MTSTGVNVNTTQSRPTAATARDRLPLYTILAPGLTPETPWWSQDLPLIAPSPSAAKKRAKEEEEDEDDDEEEEDDAEEETAEEEEEEEEEDDLEEEDDDLD